MSLGNPCRETHAAKSLERVIVIVDGSHGDIAARLAAILSAVRRGAVAIQIRDKSLDGGPLLQLARDVLDVAGPAGAPVWVNDRVDVAMLAGAHGVHLPEAGLPVSIARHLVGDAVKIGASRHTAPSVLAAAGDGADLVQLGPIFATPGKSAIGTEALNVRTELPSGKRLVAVGGIREPKQAEAAVAAGADAIAVIRAWTSEQAAELIATLVASVDAALLLHRRSVSGTHTVPTPL